MYKKCKDSKEILLWCEPEDEPSNKRRKKATDDSLSKKETKREEKKSRVAEVANDLKEQHQDRLKLSDPQFRLWARMYVSGVHDSLDVTLLIFQ